MSTTPRTREFFPRMKDRAGMRRTRKINRLFTPAQIAEVFAVFSAEFARVEQVFARAQESFAAYVESAAELVTEMGTHD